MNIIQILSNAVKQAHITTTMSGFTGNCGNVALALHEIAIEEYDFDGFKFAVIDRPSTFGSYSDHIALEYNGNYLDSQGVHTHEEILRLVDGGNTGGLSEAFIEIEPKAVALELVYTDESTKNNIKEQIHQHLPHSSE